MLQKNVLTGALFMFGIAINSPVMLFGCVVAMLAGLFVAKLCQFDVDKVDSGLYGYNAALSGITVLYLLPLNFISFVLVIFAAALSTLLMHLALRKLPELSPFTMPFVVSSWLLFALVEFSSLVTLEQSTLVSVTTVTLLDYFQGALRGVAQIMLQDNWLTGVIFLFALLVQDYKVGLWALAGSVLSIQLASLFGFAEALILLGLYGYNGCLVAIALSAIYPKKYGLILFALVTSLLMMQLFIEFSLPALTAPFVLSTWLAIVLNVSSAKRLKAAIIDD